MWDSASDEVKHSYGKTYHEALYTGTVEAAKEAAKSTMDVIDAMEEAVANKSPNIRYLVDGSSKLVDINNVSASLVSCQYFVRTFYLLYIDNCLLNE